MRLSPAREIRDGIHVSVGSLAVADAQALENNETHEKSVTCVSRQELLQNPADIGREIHETILLCLSHHKSWRHELCVVAEVPQRDVGGRLGVTHAMCSDKNAIEGRRRQIGCYTCYV